jgi:hypothetical protein
VAATFDPGVVAWLDPSSGEIAHRVPVGGEPALLSGGGAIWLVDLRSGRAWHLRDAGTLIGPVVVTDVDHAAVDGHRLWWTSRHDTVLRSSGHEIEIGVGPGERGGFVVCAGSVWISVSSGLIRVNAWNAEIGIIVPVPSGLLSHLACAGGVLVGVSARHEVFVLDPRVDADMRRLDADIGDDINLFVATRTRAWAFPARKAEARLVTIGPG